MQQFNAYLTFFYQIHGLNVVFAAARVCLMFTSNAWATCSNAMATEGNPQEMDPSHLAICNPMTILACSVTITVH